MNNDIGFLHITDLHIKDEFCYTLIDPLILAIKKEKFSKLFVLVTGDIAQSGDIEQYNIATIFFKKLRKELFDLYQKEIDLLFIPGNHDLNFVKKVSSNDRFDEIKRLKDGYRIPQESTIIINEKEKLSNYYDFLNNNNYFSSKDTISTQTAKIDNYEIKFVLVNSAIFSAYHDEENDNDKNFHFIQERDIKKIDVRGSNLSIMLIHHAPEWYTEECKFALLDSIVKGGCKM